MTHLEELDRLIREYIDFALTLKQTSLVQKMFMDKRQNDGDHPAHMAFFEAVGSWAAEFAAASPSQEELTKALEQLLLTAYGYRDKMPYWYLLAIQGHAVHLIPLLEEERRQPLLKAFEAQYPRSSQLPAQRQVSELLRGQKAQKRKSLLSFFRF